jgi:hypothetical protein
MPSWEEMCLCHHEQCGSGRLFVFFGITKSGGHRAIVSNSELVIDGPLCAGNAHALMSLSVVKSKSEIRVRFGLPQERWNGAPRKPCTVKKTST